MFIDRYLPAFSNSNATELQSSSCDLNLSVKVHKQIRIVIRYVLSIAVHLPFTSSALYMYNIIYPYYMQKNADSSEINVEADFENKFHIIDVTWLRLQICDQNFLKRNP